MDQYSRWHKSMLDRIMIMITQFGLRSSFWRWCCGGGASAPKLMCGIRVLWRDCPFSSVSASIKSSCCSFIESARMRGHHPPHYRSHHRWSFPSDHATATFSIVAAFLICGLWGKVRLPGRRSVDLSSRVYVGRIISAHSRRPNGQIASAANHKPQPIAGIEIRPVDYRPALNGCPSRPPASVADGDK